MEIFDQERHEICTREQILLSQVMRRFLCTGLLMGKAGQSETFSVIEALAPQVKM